MNKESIINKITLIETSDYRKRGLLLTGIYTHEPFGFRKDLFEILNKLSEEDLKKLYELKITI